MSYNIIWKTAKANDSLPPSDEDIKTAMSVIRTHALKCDADATIVITMSHELAQIVAAGINRQGSGIARVNLGQSSQYSEKHKCYLSTLYVARTSAALQKAKYMEG